MTNCWQGQNFTSISSNIPQQHNLISLMSSHMIIQSRIKVCLLLLELNEVELNDNIQILHIKLIIWRQGQAKFFQKQYNTIWMRLSLFHCFTLVTTMTAIRPQRGMILSNWWFSNWCANTLIIIKNIKANTESTFGSNIL